MFQASHWSANAEKAASYGLDLHNQFRTDHNVPPLKLDLGLCEQAESFAHSVANGRQPSTKDENGLGRNVYRLQRSSESADVSDIEAVKEALTMWYGYGSEYNWRIPLRSSVMSKQFSQMVWKSTQKLGIGLVRRGEDCGKRLIVIVALYSPSNNSATNQSFNENVFRGSKF